MRNASLDRITCAELVKDLLERADWGRGPARCQRCPWADPVGDYRLSIHGAVKMLNS